MTNDDYINQNKTGTFNKGDQVIMAGCHEATLPEYKKKIWVCQTDSYRDKGNEDVVFLEGFSGCFLTQYLVKKSYIKN